MFHHATLIILLFARKDNQKECILQVFYKKSLLLDKNRPKILCLFDNNSKFYIDNHSLIISIVQTS